MGSFFFCLEGRKVRGTKMVVYMQRDVLEDVAIIGGLVGVQFVYAGNSVLLGYLMSLGLGPFTIVIFSTLATFIILSPFAVYFERWFCFLYLFFLESPWKFGEGLMFILQEQMAQTINLEVDNSAGFDLLWRVRIMFFNLHFFFLLFLNFCLAFLLLLLLLLLLEVVIIVQFWGKMKSRIARALLYHLRSVKALYSWHL